MSKKKEAALATTTTAKGRIHPGDRRKVGSKRARVKPLAEKLFMRQVTDLADARGWQWIHLRPSRGYSEQDTWRTAATGSLAKGWPDLFLCRDDQLLFLELKSTTKVTPDQEKVLAYLGHFGLARVYYPNDWDLIEQILR